MSTYDHLYAVMSEAYGYLAVMFLSLVSSCPTNSKFVQRIPSVCLTINMRWTCMQRCSRLGAWIKNNLIFPLCSSSLGQKHPLKRFLKHSSLAVWDRRIERQKPCWGGWWGLSPFRIWGSRKENRVGNRQYITCFSSPGFKILTRALKGIFRFSSALQVCKKV